jgi:VWFA-related protein
LFCAAGLVAQEPTFRIDRTLIIVNVSVKDKSGNPITNLKRDDFEVYEDNTRQSVGVFELQTLKNDLLPPVDFTDAPKTFAERVTPAPGAAAAKPTGQLNAVRHSDKRLIALFFDLSSMQQLDQIRAKESAEKFLKTQMTSSDLVSIMTFANKFQVIEDFTDDRERLFAAIQKIVVGEGSENAADASTGADEGDDSGAFAADDTEFNIFNTDRKLSALEDAARKLAAFPEKKQLVYFSGGVSKTGVENESQLKATVNAAIRANVAFYPVDARGLVAQAPGGDASVASPRGTGVFTGSTQRSRASSFNGSQDTLYTLAADTGGKALLDSNDLGLGIKNAQNDLSSYYIIGYYSSNSNLDGKYRKISVKLKTPIASAKLDYRQGYFAGKTFNKFTSGDKERQLEEALTLGDPVSELPVALEVDYFRVAKDRYFIPISVKIPGSAVGLTKKGGNETAQLDFIGQITDAQGRQVGGVRDFITIKLNENDAAKVGQRHLQYDAGLTLAPGVYDLKFLARENLSGKMGTFETKFTVPDLQQSKSLKLSSVVWSSQKEAVTSAVGAADNNKKTIAGHPLIQNGQKLVPSITRVFRKDQTLYAYFEVYDPALDPDRKVPDLQAQVDLITGGKKAMSSATVRVNKLETSRPGVAAFSFQIPLSRLPAGRYISQASVIDENGKKFSFPRNSIVVLP